MIKYYNKKRKLIIDEEVYNIYVCGPTVYNDVHIGNIRPILFFSIIRNILSLQGKKVNLVQNITDIDDKIINSALENEKTIEEISSKYSKNYISLLDEIGLKKINFLYASDYKKEYINIIDKLLENKIAYKTSSGIYIKVSQIEGYGSISSQDINELKLGTRIESDDDKQSPHDFALIKFDSNHGWESKYGKFRPGWHLECYTMIDNYFEDKITIHGGGVDLCFPHHENENAISIALNNLPLSKHWLHVGMMTVDGVKMSKSKNNFIFAKDFIKNNGENVTKLLFLQTTYSKPINISMELINEVTKFDKQLLSIFNHLRIYSKVCEQEEIELEQYDKINKYLSEMSFSNVITEIKKIIKQINSKTIKRSNYNSILELLEYTMKIFDISYPHLETQELIDQIKILETMKFSDSNKEILEKYPKIKKTRLGWEI